VTATLLLLFLIGGELCCPARINTRDPDLGVDQIWYRRAKWVLPAFGAACAGEECELQLDVARANRFSGVFEIAAKGDAAHRDLASCVSEVRLRPSSPWTRQF
jgi:hypothetical protein